MSILFSWAIILTLMLLNFNKLFITLKLLHSNTFKVVVLLLKKKSLKVSNFGMGFTCVKKCNYRSQTTAIICCAINLGYHTLQT